MDRSLVRPLADFLCQARTHRILLHVEPFLRITLILPQTMMESPRLPNPIGVVMRLTKLALPIANPPLNGEGQITRGGEQMQVVRH